MPDVRMGREAKENLLKLAVHAEGGVYGVLSDVAENLFAVFLGERRENIGLAHRVFFSCAASFLMRARDWERVTI